MKEEIKKEATSNKKERERRQNRTKLSIDAR